MRKLLITLALLCSSLAAFAPNTKVLTLATGEAINPYLRIAIAISRVESRCQDTAFNPIEGATGRFQARQIMLDQYNQETGMGYLLSELRDSAISTRVFLHHATKYYYNDIERISRTWNGGLSGMDKNSTQKYYQKVLLSL